MTRNNIGQGKQAMTTPAVSKGILLAGGTGSRLFPLTVPVCKQLLPIYDKPLIYYPLSVLLLAGVRETLIITTPRDLEPMRRTLGDGSRFGVKLHYTVQDSPRGIAEAILIGEEFTVGEPFWLILGDNIFFGHGMTSLLLEEAQNSDGATVFTYAVSDPRPYAVAEVDRDGTVLDLVEKPPTPRTNLAVTGLYRYDKQAVGLARQLTPSRRGELEITDLNRFYLAAGNLKARRLRRGIAWMDAGTPESLLQASQFVRLVEERQGLKIACLEEIAFLRDYIGAAELQKIIKDLGDNDYSRYLAKIAADQTAV